MPRLTGPTQDGSHVAVRPGHRSQRQTATTRNGTKSASVPPLANGPTRTPVSRRVGANHRRARGSMQKTSTAVSSQAARSTQSLIMWVIPSAMTGAWRRNEPAG